MEERQVSYIEYEAGMARMERMVKRLWISSIILTGMLVVSNIAWAFHIFG